MRNGKRQEKCQEHAKWSENAHRVPECPVDEPGGEGSSGDPLALVMQSYSAGQDPENQGTCLHACKMWVQELHTMESSGKSLSMAFAEDCIQGSLLPRHFKYFFISSC